MSINFSAKVWVLIPILILSGCNSPRAVIIKPPPLNLVELPEYGLDFWVTTDKRVYQVGEPITIGIKVKNSDTKPHTLRFAPGTDAKPYPVPHAVAYGLINGWLPVNFLTLTFDPITATVPPNTEMQIEALNVVWRQDDELLREHVPIGTYGIGSHIGRLDVDGKRVDIGLFFIDEGVEIPLFAIIHPVTEALKEQHGIIFRGGAKFLYEPNETVRMLAGIENRSGQTKTVSLKPIGNYPLVRISVFGPARRNPYPPPRPRQVAFYDLNDEVKVTIEPGQIYTILDWRWDQKDLGMETTVPFGEPYLWLIEVCGSVEVNGQNVGVIEKPLKVFWSEFEIDEEKPVEHIDLTVGTTPSPPISEPPSEPPPPPDL